MKTCPGISLLTRHACVVLVAPFVLFHSAAAIAQLPNPALTHIYPAGGQVGTTIEVTVSGRDLDDGSRLVFSHPGIEGQVKISAATEFEPEGPVPNQFVVRIANNVPPGFYEARVSGRYGLSTSRAFAVQTQKQFVEPGNNHKVESANQISIDTVILGRCNANAVDHYSFEAKQGQSIAIDCQTTQIDSRLLPIVAVLSESGRPLVRSSAARDAQLHFDVPADGKYIIAVHDHIYEGGADHAYRMTVSSAPVIDFILPAVAQANRSTEFTIYGRNLPGATESKVSFAKTKLQKKKVRIYIPAASDMVQRSPSASKSLGLLTFPYQLTTVNGSSNFYPIGVTAFPVIVETEPNDRETPQRVETPVEFTGNFYPHRDEDAIRFTAKKGQAYHVDLMGHRLGRELDPAVFVWKVVKDDKGNESLQNVKVIDDRGFDNDRYQRFVPRGLDIVDNDPVVNFTSDHDGDYCVSIRDLYGSTRNDPRSVYRLIVRPTTPDFKLVAWSQRHLIAGNDTRVDAATSVIRPGGSCVLQVDARRSTFDGDITIKVHGLPAGVTCNEVLLQTGKTEATLVAMAAEDAQPWQGFITVEGSAMIDGLRVTRKASYGMLTSDTGNVRNERPRGRQTTQLAFSVIDEKAPIAIQISSPDVFRTSRGGKVTIPVNYLQNEKAKGELKIRPYGLPGEVQAKELTLKPDAKDGNLELSINNAKTPLGTYACFMVGQVTANRQRSAKEIAIAEQLKKDFETEFAKLVQAESDSNAAKDAALKVRDQHKETLSANEASVAQAKIAAAALNKEVETLKAQLSSLADNATNATDLQKAVVEKEARTTQADKETETTKQRTEKSRAELQAREQELQAAEQAFKNAAEKKKRAEAHRKTLEDRFNNVKKQNEPKDVVLTVMSNPIQIEIVNSPTKLDVTPSEIRVKKPATELMADVSVKIERQFGFDGDIDLRIEPPNNQPGFQIATTKMTKGSNQADLKLAIKPDVKPGNYAFQIKSKLKFGGVDIEDISPLLVVVE